MADGLGYDEGSDKTILTDDTGAAGHAQVVKLAYGADGVATLAQLDADGLLVNLGANNDITGTVTANLGATDNAVLDDIAAKLGTIDADTSALAGAISGTEVQVDIVSLPAVDTELTTGDLDTGAGTDTRAVVGLVGSASGGGQLIPGSSADGLLVNLGANNDITGTVTANLGATDNAVLDDIAAKLATIDADTGALAAVDFATGAAVASLGVVGGGVEATALRVTLASDSTGTLSVDDGGGALTVDGTVTANLSATDNAVLDNIDADTSAIQTAVELLDDAVVADDAAFTPATTKVVMAGFEYDDTTPDSVDEGDAGAARMSARREIYTQIRDAAGNERGANVDASNRLTVLADLGATDNAVLDNIDADLTTIIGHVDGLEGLLTTIDADTGALAAVDFATGADVASLGVVGGGVEATALRVTLASDSTGTLSVDDGGGALTVDGTVTANLGATDNAVLDAIAAALAGTLTVTGGGGGTEYEEGATDAAITGSAILWEDAADTLRAVSAAKPLPVDLGANNDITGTVTAELSATDNAVLDDIAAKLGTIDADTSALAGAVAGTEVQVDVVAALPAGTNAIGKLAANSGVDIGDVDVTSIAAGTNVIGATLGVSGLMIENAVSVTVKYAAIDAATSGDNTIVAAVAGKKIRVLSLFLVAAGTVNVRFENGAGGTALTGQMNLIANTGFVLPHNPHGWFQCGTDNTLLNLELSAAVSVDGALTYIEAE